MSAKEEQFLRLIETAISEADAVASSAKEQWLVEDAQMAKDNFCALKDQLLSGALSHSGGSGLGITRALGEWAPPSLYEAGAAVENYFMGQWK